MSAAEGFLMAWGTIATFAAVFFHNSGKNAYLRILHLHMHTMADPEVYKHGVAQLEKSGMMKHMKEFYND
jgi:hypothetical protein